MKRIFKALCYGLTGVFLVTLLGVAIHLKSPYLFAFRSYETPFLLLITFTLILIYFFKAQGIHRFLGLMILSAVLFFTVLGECSFQYHRHTVMNMDTAAANRLGRHFVVGYEDVEALKPLILQGLIGGVFVTRRNTYGKNFESLRQEIAALQHLRMDAGLRPLIIATDQEGGIVSHLSPPLERMLPLASVIEESNTNEALIVNAQTYGEIQGQALAILGITVNLSPVVDLKSEHASGLLDFHSLISQRAISSDPNITTAVGNAYVRGLKNQGVLATLKHFPGLGRVNDDTHHFSASLDTTPNELEQTDWLPFREIAYQSDALLMIGHVILTAVDQKNPASFSKEVIQGIIREGWQHNGILITDDMTMRAAYKHGFCNATVNALNAGMDFLLVSYDYEKFYEMMYCAAQAYQNGQLESRMLELSNARMIRFLP